MTFEQGVNPIIAEKMTSERSRDYMNARRVAKEYEACTRGLNKAAPCVPPTGSQDEIRQVSSDWRLNPFLLLLLAPISYRYPLTRACFTCLAVHGQRHLLPIIEETAQMNFLLFFHSWTCGKSTSVGKSRTRCESRIRP